MSGQKSVLSIKNICLNPGIIGTVLGLVFFLFSINLPNLILTPIGYLADLNTPLPMIIIGYYLAHSNLKRAFTSLSSYISMSLRLVIIPLLTLLCLYSLNVKGDLLVSLVISASAPVAAIATMFSAKFNRDIELSVSLVSASSILSIVTMPIIVGFAQYLAA